MPRTPKQEKKTITVVVNGKPIAVTLYPPKQSRRAWYAFWVGLTFAKSTGHANFEDAVVAAQEMVKGGGKKPSVADAVLSDQEFEEVQRVYFGRKRDPAAQVRAQKSLFSCLNAIAAFRRISGLSPITLATPDDCAAFQQKALKLPKNWRHGYPNGKKDVELSSPNTVLKWSRSLQAAFERVNRNALKRRCVRGVVPENKLLTANPWNKFPWIEGRKRPIRQFDGAELLSFLDYLKASAPSITVASALAKVFLWSGARRQEITALSWSTLRVVGSEYHFAIVGKWGVERWFRIPEGLYRDLLELKTDSPFVFATYTDQLRQLYAKSERPWAAQHIGTEFTPDRLGDWFFQRLAAWSKNLPKGHATTHIFRKTALQFARRGEDLNHRVAADAKVSESVMMASYVQERDEELHQASNRTFQRLVAGLPAEVLSVRLYSDDAQRSRKADGRGDSPEKLAVGC